MRTVTECRETTGSGGDTSFRSVNVRLKGRRDDPTADPITPRTVRVVKIANRNPAWNRCNERAQPETCSAVAEATSHSGGGPLRGKAYHPHP